VSASPHEADERRGVPQGFNCTVLSRSPAFLKHGTRKDKEESKQNIRYLSQISINQGFKNYSEIKD
jgi:hypothetical protein